MPTPKHSGPDGTLRVRLAGSLGIAGLLALNGLGLEGLGWCGLVCAAALSVNWAASKAAAQVHTSDFQRFFSALSVAIEGLIWSVPAMMLWSHGDDALRPAAIGLLFVQIYFAAAFAYREWISLVICGLPPALVLMGLVSFDTRSGWTARLTTILVMAGALGFALILARINAKALEALVKDGQRPPGA